MISPFRSIIAVGTIAIASTAFSPAPLLAGIIEFGDSDGDGDVDNFDLTLMLGNYGLADGATLANGDADGDGDVDQADFQIATVSFTGGGSGSAGNTSNVTNAAKLFYNPANGALLLDQTNAQNGIIISFIIQSNNAFNIVNPVTFPFAQNLSTRTTSVVAQTDPFALDSPTGFPTNPYNLGNLLPSGLTLAGLQAISLRGVYLGAVAGAGGSSIGTPGQRLHSFDLAIVPEASAAASAFIAMTTTMAVTQLRRRRSQRS